MIPKNTSWKHAFTCQNCGTLSPGRKGEANRFCKNDCQHEFSVKRWIECSICIAKIGIGSKIAGRLLGISPTSVSRGWKSRGIIANRPKSGSIIHDGRAIITKQNQREQRVWRQYETAWTDEIASHKAFPDWSKIWKNEMARRDSILRYHSMTIDQKKERIKKRIDREKREMGIEGYRAFVAKKRREWKEKPENMAKHKQWTRDAIAKRKTNDPGFRIQCNLRNRMKEVMGSVVKGGWDGRSNFTGCNTNQLARHLERQFKRGMTWKNYGTKWHVDHILPCASFDHTDPKQVAQCWHWTNLRPLDAKLNMKKGATIEEPQMSLLLCVTH